MTTIQPRTSVVTIYQGDYLDRIRHLEQRYDAAVRSAKSEPTRSLGELSQVDKLAAEHAALAEEALESAVHVTLTALGRKAWRALVAAHPPRVGNDDDQSVGVNEESFKDPLIMASIVSPDLSEDDLDILSEADNDRLYLTAWALNRAPATAPKALRVSPTNQPSDATSN